MSQSQMIPEPPRKSNRSIVFSILAIIIGMAGLAYGSVPLYRIFCQVTGFGGTTQKAAEASYTIGKKTLVIRFDSNIASDLNWDFNPLQQSVSVKTGENKLAFYTAHNNSNQPITGMATFNVTPDAAGIYFNKVHCFCFDKQTLKAGEKVEMPVSFFVDPKIETDPETRDINTITLSYTFFKAAN